MTNLKASTSRCTWIMVLLWTTAVPTTDCSTVAHTIAAFLPQHTIHQLLDEIQIKNSFGQNEMQVSRATHTKIHCTRWQPDLWQASKHSLVNIMQAVIICLYHTFRPCSTTVMSPNLPYNPQQDFVTSKFTVMQQTNVLINKQWLLHIILLVLVMIYCTLLIHQEQNKS